MNLRSIYATQPDFIKPSYICQLHQSQGCIRSQQLQLCFCMFLPHPPNCTEFSPTEKNRQFCLVQLYLPEAFGKVFKTNKYTPIRFKHIWKCVHYSAMSLYCNTARRPRWHKLYEGHIQGQGPMSSHEMFDQTGTPNVEMIDIYRAIISRLTPV